MTEPFLLNGTWRTSPATWSVHYPFDDAHVADVARAGPDDVEEAIVAGLEGANAMRRLPRHERSRILRDAATVLGRDVDSWARRITLESGKPLRDARHEVGRAANTLTAAADEIGHFGAEYVALDRAASSRGDLGLMVREPIGLIAAITPFNAPLNLVVHKLAPAIASGNAVVLKPALQTPLTALHFARTLLEVGLPPAALSVLPCSNEDAAPLVDDVRVRGLSFTGSQVGWSLKARAVRKHVTLEMGGNGGIIVHRDADLEIALDAALKGAFGSSGQRCISSRRLLVHESVAPRFEKEFCRRASALVFGNPLDPATQIGPLVTESAARRAEEWVQQAIDAGARLLSGGERKRAIVTPTVLTDVPNDSRVWCEELFAPVTTVRRYVHLDEAIEIMNEGPYGLQAGIFTRDIAIAHHAFKELRFGGVMVNQDPGFRAEHMPYGGTKASGFGREGLKYAMDSMTEPKMLVLTVGSLAEGT